MTEPLNLFLIEDDDDIALLMRKCLERAGHQVTTCRTAADALIVLGHSAFNLVLLGQQLPDLSGLGLLETFKKEGISAPVLMVAVSGDEMLATKVLHAGALDYIVKDSALTFLVDLPKRVEEAVGRHRLQEMNRMLIQALESARDGILITDVQGNILNVNQALEQMSGFDRAELIGANPRIFKSGMHPPELYATLWRTILSRSSWQGEIVNRKKDGALFDASVTVSPIFDDRGQLTRFVGIYRDVSDRKQLERQLLQAQKMQSVGTLAGGVAHEFNNLLAGIQGYAALAVREPDLPKPVVEYLEFIMDLSDRAAGLTRQLLAFARKPALSRGPTRIDKLVKSTVGLVRKTLHVDIGLELPDESTAEEMRTLADANQLQQVLLNLVINARDAVQEVDARGDGERENGPSIRLALEHTTLDGDLAGFPEIVPAGDYIVVTVQDNGAGMTHDVLSQAFDPFFTTKKIGKGTGLGLPVAFGIVQGHQGHLTIETAVGKGTRVRLYLPRLAGEVDARSRQFTGGQILEPETQQGRRILVVDDEAAVRDVVARFLEIAGHQVVTADSVAQAVQLPRDRAAVDLVVLDLMIPGERGETNVKAIQQRFPGVPVLLCTGLLQTEEGAAYLEKASGILRKPFRMNELWYAVNQAIENGNRP